MLELPTVVPYFDLSLQHASAPLLRAMKRWGDGDRFMQIRKYEGEPFNGFIVNKVNAGDVTIFRGK